MVAEILTTYVFKQTLLKSNKVKFKVFGGLASAVRRSAYCACATEVQFVWWGGVVDEAPIMSSNPTPVVTS